MPNPEERRRENERQQRLVDTKLELQHERNRYEILSSKYLILFLVAPVWGNAAREWSAKGYDISSVGFLVSMLTILAGSIGYLFYRWKYAKIRQLVGLPPSNAIDEASKTLLREEGKRPVRVVHNPHERATDRRRT
jgi:hypothetical protein